jgi:hypothetical protein
MPRLPKSGFFARIATAALLATGLGFGALSLPGEAQAAPTRPAIGAPVAQPDVQTVQYYGHPPPRWHRGPPPRYYGPPPRARYYGPPPRARYYGPPPRWHRGPPPRWHNGPPRYRY